MEKPRLTSDQLIAVLNRIDKGQPGVLDKVKAHFSLTKAEENFIYMYEQCKPLRDGNLPPHKGR
jgi:hypothetical protein